MHIGFSLVTAGRGMLGGTDTYVRGLLGAFRVGGGPDRVTVLTSAASSPVYASEAGGAIELAEVPGLDPNAPPPLRAWQMLRGAQQADALNGIISDDLQLVHYPIVVPLPRTHLPRVITLHDVRHLAMPEQFGRAQRVWRRYAYDRTATRVQHVITVSEHARRSIIETLGVSEDRVTAIYHGIEHARFNPNDTGRDDVILQSLAVPSSYIFYPAALWPHKNHDRLLEAFARIEDSETSLVLSGETYGTLPRFQQRVERLGLSKRVRHLGYISADALPSLYRRARALVFPTLYEGFGVPPLEAMACGTPCVLPLDGAVREVSGGIGELADAADPSSIAQAVSRVLDDRDLRSNLIERGLEHASHFTWARSASAHRRVYEAALA